MSYHEYVGNMHIHTAYSDGAAYHQEITQAALSAGLDYIITTDHNIYVDGVQGYYGSEEQGHVLVLTGEEVHDRTRQPQVSHCLVYGAGEEMTQFADNPQQLIDETHKRGGLTFLAHPCDVSIFWDRTWPKIPWVDWDISDYTGLEIWNYMADFKDVVHSPWQGLRGSMRPEKYVIGPVAQTLEKWDSLLAQGQRVVGIGGADAHAWSIGFGSFSRIIFPYDYLFSCVNTHILTPTPLAGDMQHDAQLIYTALQRGRVFIGYEILGNTKGFRFTAQGGMSGATSQMGSSIRLEHGVTLQVLAPAAARIKIIHNGRMVHDQTPVEKVTFVAREAGAYRVEVWREYEGKERCWILSNPIYVEPNLKPVGETANV